MGAGPGSTAERSEPVFTFADARPGDSLTVLLGAWRPIGAGSPTATAFGASDSSSELSVWRAAYPAEETLALAILAAAEGDLVGTKRALATAQVQLTQVVRTEPGAPGRVSRQVFSLAGPGTATTSPETELRDLLDEIQAMTPSVSFGFGEQLATGWEQAWQTTQDTLGRLRDDLGHAALVETRVDGVLVGRTVVGWLGDAEATLSAGGTTTALTLHRRTVALALASRELLLRTIEIALRGAATIGLLLGTPGGQLLALPAVYRFVTRVLAESRTAES